ncbi:hypothetical protein D030_2004B, partial [Vibrio parahaemolyticus AQ3810]
VRCFLLATVFERLLKQAVFVVKAVAHSWELLSST